MKIRMLVGQEGPTISRVRGQELEIGTDVDADEAARLVDADFAEEVPEQEAPAAETPPVTEPDEKVLEQEAPAAETPPVTEPAEKVLEQEAPAAETPPAAKPGKAKAKKLPAPAA